MDNVAQWLEQLGLTRYADAFAANDIDEEVLAELTDGELEKLGVSLGHRKKILKAIAILRDGDPASPKPGRRAIRRPTAPMDVAEPERRQLTVMFCDLVGSTRLSQKLDPEDLRDINLAYQDVCRIAIDRFDGYISRYLGDGILAFFGYPQAHEDDAERAVRAALGVIASMGRLNAGVGKDKGVELAVRVGIATGPVVVGDLIGEGASEERAAVGETPNLAARLQSLAEPDTVIIADSTRQLLTQTFDFENLGSRDLHGFEEQQTVWQALRQTRAEGRFEAQHAANLTPLVGRRDEIGMLMSRWELAKEGKGQVVLLDGEAGVGKSRIVSSLRSRLADETHASLFFQCSPYHANSPLYPVIRRLEVAAQFDDDDPPDAKLDKLVNILTEETSNPETVAPLFAGLMSLPFEHRFEALDVTPEQRKEKTLDVLADQLRDLSAQAPVLAVFEDVHWIDPTSLDLVDRMVEQVSGLRVLLIISFRPEFESPWPRHSYLTVISLSRLVDEHCLDMVEDIARDIPLSRTLIERIVQKADGIPLFVEELTKTILESGALAENGAAENATDRRSLAIPSTVQTSLMARLDRLENAKWVAQIGGAIGREFSHELLVEVASRSEDELDAALARLVESGLVFRHGAPPKATYTFKHALVQDVAYESLLHSRRPELHLRIAEAMERRHPAASSTMPELLAHHYARAKRPEQAIYYWQLAGERAIERSANAEALNHLSNAMALLGDLPDSPVHREQELSLLIMRGPVEIAVRGSGCPGAEEVYARAVALCAELPDSPRHFAAHWGQWRTSKTYTTKRERADTLMPIAENLGDPGLQLQAHHCQWASLFNLAFHRQCCEHVEQGIEIYEAGDYRFHAALYGGHDPAVCGHGEAALSLWLLGYPEKALAQIERALAVSQSLAHSASRAHVLDIALMLHSFCRDANEVFSRASEMIAFSEYEEFAVHHAKGEIFRGWAQIRLGNVEQGLADVRVGIDALRNIGTNEDLPFFLGMLAEGYGVVGDPRQGLAEIDAAFFEADKVASRFWDAELLRRKGELLLAAGESAETDAEECFAESLRIAREQQARSLALRTASSYARLLGRRGEDAAALELLAPAFDWFGEGFESPDLADVRRQLDALHAATGKA